MIGSDTNGLFGYAGERGERNIQRLKNRAHRMNFLVSYGRPVGPYLESMRAIASCMGIIISCLTMCSANKIKKQLNFSGSVASGNDSNICWLQFAQVSHFDS